jgi:ABC-type dipeptide/oligopeptide/nickel transport system permease subunit
MWMCAAFAVVCFVFAYSGFSSLGTMVDEAERELSRGYAWFWVFLSCVGLAFGVLSWMIKEGKLGDPDQM